MPPLNDVLVPIPVAGGLDQKTDEKLVQSGQSSNLINVTFDSVGAQQKRRGNSLISPAPIQALPGQFIVPPMQQLATFNDELLGIPYPPGQLYAYTGDQTWVSSSLQLFKGSPPEVAISRSTVAQSNQAANNPQVACSQGYIVYAWMTNASTNDTGGFLTTTGQIVLEIVDQATGTAVYGPTVLPPAINGFYQGFPRLAVLRTNPGTFSDTVVLTWLEGNAPGEFSFQYMSSICITCSSSPSRSFKVGNVQSLAANFASGPIGSYDTCGTVSTFYVAAAVYDGSGEPPFDMGGFLIAPYAATVVSGTVGVLETNTYQWQLLSGALDAQSQVTVGCDVTGTFNGSSNLLAGYSFTNGITSQQFNLCATSWSVLEAIPTFYGTPKSASIDSVIPLLPLTTSPAYAIGVSFRNSSSAGIVYSYPSQGTEPAPPAIPSAAQAAFGGTLIGQNIPLSLASVVKPYFDLPLKLIDYSAPLLRSNYYVRAISKPFWVNNAWASGSSRCYVVGLQDIFADDNDFQQFSTAYVFDTGLDTAILPASSSTDQLQWRVVGTVANRQLVMGDSLSEPIFTDGFCGNVASLGGTTNAFVACIPSNPGQGIEYPVGSSFQQLMMDFSPFTQYQSETVGENLLLACGTPSYYDGIQLGDVGFTSYPLIMSDYAIASTGSAQSIAAGASMAPGVYGYNFVYEYVDSQGQVHQSAPSINPSSSAGIIVTVPYGLGGTVPTPCPASSCTGSVSFFIPNLCIGNRTIFPVSGTTNLPSVAVYRTTCNGTIPYRLTPANPPYALQCNPQEYGIWFTDYVNDSIINTNGDPLDQQPIIYTEGGVLPYFSPPACRYCTIWQNALWIAGIDDPKTVWWSNQQSDGLALSFNDGLQLRIDDGDDITGIIAMDSYLIVFKSDRIFYITGQQPNAEGQNNALYPPVKISSDIGCINARSIVLTQLGVMFQSAAGISLLDRSLNVTSNFGMPVQETLRQFPQITSAVIVPDQQQVRFTCGGNETATSSTSAGFGPTWGQNNPWGGGGFWGGSGAVTQLGLPANFLQGCTIVFDYNVNQWTVFNYLDDAFLLGPGGSWDATIQSDGYYLTGTMPACATLFDGDYTWGSTLNMSAGTPMQGAIYQENPFEVVPTSGSFTDNGAYVPSLTETAWIKTSGINGFQRARRVVVQGTAFDSCQLQVSYATDYDDDGWISWDQVPVSDEDSTISFRFHIGQQKCRSIRFRVVDYAPNLSLSPLPFSDQGVQITGFDLWVGSKRGPQKLPPGRSY